MQKVTTVFLNILLIILLIGSLYQSFSLVKIGQRLNAENFSIGPARAAGYNFAGPASLDELPDMAGGC